MQYSRIAWLALITVCGLSSQAAALSTCTWNEVSARLLELNANAPLGANNISYMNDYQGQIVKADSLIQAAQMRDNLQAACDVVVQLESNSSQINSGYR
jgi:hypothetical protein